MTRATRSRPDLSLGPYVCRWIETFCVHGPGDILGQPVELTIEEQQFLWWAYELDEGGGRTVRRAVRGLPKGSRKTEFAAWVSLAELAGPVRCAGFRDGKPVPTEVHDPFVVTAAASYDQADLLFGAAVACVREGPLGQWLEAFENEILFKQETGRAGKIKRVPAVAGTNDGLRPTFVCCDETHEWTGNKQRVHLVLLNGLSKRKDAWSLDITTAGNPKAQSVALSQYELGQRVLAGELDYPDLLFDWREPSVNLDELTDPDVLVAAVAAANPEPWKRVDDIARRFHEVPLHDFARYHLNIWCEPDDERWLPPGTWVDVADESRPAPPAGTRIVLGFDGSYSGDSTALVGCTVEEVPHLFVVGHWEHPGGHSDWHVPIDEVEACVRDAMERWKVVELSADPPYWAQQITRWEEQYGDVVVRFETYVRKRMAAACSEFYQAATTGGLSHDGHLGLDRHVGNAVLKETAQGAYITKHRDHPERKIDLAVAAVVAFVRASWHVQQKPRRAPSVMFA